MYEQMAGSQGTSPNGCTHNNYGKNKTSNKQGFNLAQLAGFSLKSTTDFQNPSELFWLVTCWLKDSPHLINGAENAFKSS